MADESEMTAMFQAMQAELLSRQVNVDHLQKTMEALASQETLFDKSDVEVTRALLEVRRKELQHMEQNFIECQAMYNERIKAVENLILEKDRQIKELDATLGAISGEPTLTEHFAAKHAEQLRALHQAKAQLCANLRQRFRDGAGANGGWGGDAPEPPSQSHPSHHSHHSHYSSHDHVSSRGRRRSGVFSE